MRDALYQALLVDKKVKVPFSRLKQLVIELDGAMRLAPDLDDQVAVLVQAMAAGGLVMLPSVNSRRSWSGPRRNWPNFINVPANKREATCKPNYQHFHQKVLPLLTGPHALPRSGKILERLEKISQWLARKDGHEIVPVPLAERSLEIFSYEKALKATGSNGVIYDTGVHQLTLADLGAFYVAPPLAWESPFAEPEHVGERPLLVVENSTPYYSLTRWNRQAKVYACIVYGSGKQVEASLPQQSELLDTYPQAEIRYFGDIDPEGIAIFQGAERAMQQHEQRKLVPDLSLYQTLLDIGIGSRQDFKEKELDFDKLRAQFGDSVTGQIQQLFASGKRISQEHLGLHTLNSRFCDGLN
ncbi:Wadjet anti-phage system protein JetD domain-containing protein [Vibrio neptunius]|uniref:Wadjet protein JetD C-terminal domain-containing protein n=1 Tax=Vibrio neptunius TaxID=170651 RepID=A0ABS3A2G4_9VIBR|nr:Wadjet anti-phage system protein JetD domain-containing protein [Vibrio neptunius]MBN3493787.1 hypothetical protein [Vibrio neptunius]MBN3516283.1 hypothetical protein [Vibrio neptunius]MBN3550228.1 hypothetical protein [Vibrio neptunius]MBN3578508.1 hypothetical protein [Vibrio neptunius]MCH9872173.1 hypothetical protein [Vibrio neptunius]